MDNYSLLEALKQLSLSGGPDLPINADVKEPDGQDSTAVTGKRFASVDDDPRLAGLINKQVNNAESFNPGKYDVSGSNDLVKAYLKKMSEPLANDPGYDSALAETKKRRMVHQLFGPSGTGPSEHVAYALAGISDPANPVDRFDPEAPVKDYITKKSLAMKQREAEMSGLGKANTMSLAAPRLALAVEEAGRKAVKDPTSSLQQHGAQAHKEGVDEFKAPLEVTRTSTGVRNADTASGRLALQEDKQADVISQGIVPTAKTQHVRLQPAVAKELNDKIGAAGAVQDTLGKIRKLVEDHRTGILLPGDAQAKMQALFAELGPQWNQAQTKLSYSGPRGEAIGHAITDPTSVKGIVRDLLSGGDYSKTNLAEIDDIIDSNVRRQAKAHGVELGDKIGEMPGDGPTVKHGSPYARTEGQRGGKGKPMAGSAAKNDAMGGQEDSAPMVAITDRNTGKTKKFTMANAGKFMTMHKDSPGNDGKPRFVAGEQ